MNKILLQMQTVEQALRALDLQDGDLTSVSLSGYSKPSISLRWEAFSRIFGGKKAERVSMGSGYTHYNIDHLDCTFTGLLPLPEQDGTVPAAS